MNGGVEDYLRAIYSLCEENINQGVKSVDIATKLKVSRPSVSAMVKKLAKQGFIEVSSYSKLFLTKTGKIEAKKIMYKHRVIEVFLTDILNLNLKKVHEEAHKLEHAFSDESVKRIDNLLNNPKLSSSGKRIQLKEDSKIVTKITLDLMKKDQVGRIIKVLGKGIIHKRILEMGVVKGAKVKIIKIAPFDGPIDIKVKGYSLSLRKEEARNVEVALE